MLMFIYVPVCRTTERAQYRKEYFQLLNEAHTFNEKGPEFFSRSLSLSPGFPELYARARTLEYVVLLQYSWCKWPECWDIYANENVWRESYELRFFFHFARCYNFRYCNVKIRVFYIFLARTFISIFNSSTWTFVIFIIIVEVVVGLAREKRTRDERNLERVIMKISIRSSIAFREISVAYLSCFFFSSQEYLFCFIHGYVYTRKYIWENSGFCARSVEYYIASLNACLGFLLYLFSLLFPFEFFSFLLFSHSSPRGRCIFSWHWIKDFSA